jgi:hypothetical protein
LKVLLASFRALGFNGPRFGRNCINWSLMTIEIMKKLLSCLCALLTASSVFAAAFTPGDLVVARVGAGGVTALSSAATALFLDEYTTTGTLVQTLALPTTVIGSQLMLTIQGTATSEGFLQLSANGQYLTLAGYNAATGTAAPSGSTAAVVNRVVGLVSLNGSVDTSTAINTGTLGSTRSATTANGTGFWVSTASAGVNYIAFGAASAATQLSTAPSNTRVTRDIGGQLYVSSASSTFQGVSTIGTGLPTTSGQTTTLLNGFPTATGPSSYDFFINGNNAWVADDRANGNGGIQHWTLSAGTWTLSYTLAPTATTGVRGLAVDLSGANPTLFGTTTDNRVVEFVDTGAGSLPAFLFTDPTANTAFRGIVFIPEPTGLLGLGVVMLLLGRKLLRRRR